MEKPRHKIPTINDITVIERDWPWPTETFAAKSGGELSVLIALPHNIVDGGFLQYEPEELRGIPDIRGIRSYRVANIPEGSVGAKEWHRVRQELVFALGGAVRWSCEDVHGTKKEFTLDENTGVWTPPFIFHSYKALTEGVSIVVVANTLFDPKNDATKDTYFLEDFRALQAAYK